MTSDKQSAVATNSPLIKAAWPKIHRAGIDHGWRGVANTAWKEALAGLPIMERQHIFDMYLCLRGYNQTIPVETLEELKEFLLRHAK